MGLILNELISIKGDKNLIFDCPNILLIGVNWQEALRHLHHPHWRYGDSLGYIRWFLDGWLTMVECSMYIERKEMIIPHFDNSGLLRPTEGKRWNLLI